MILLQRYLYGLIERDAGRRLWILRVRRIRGECKRK
jgi:hypothetical protein